MVSCLASRDWLDSRLTFLHQTLAAATAAAATAATVAGQRRRRPVSHPFAHFPDHPQEKTNSTHHDQTDHLAAPPGDDDLDLHPVAAKAHERPLCPALGRIGPRLNKM